MEKEEYDPKCNGCKRSQELDDVPGGIVKLNGNWILNHYQGDEGFLGWLALQPRWHRCELAELEPGELQALGENIKKVDLALKEYWTEYFPNDLVERVYIVYFYESVHDKPTPSLFHLHIHIIPRTQRLDKLLRECTQSNSDSQIPSSTIIAWNIYQVTKHCDFPEEYRYNRKNDKDKRKAIALMNYLRSKR